jgi:FkbM family methyltransferase
MRALEGVRRRWKERKHHRTVFSWCLCLYDRILQRTRVPLPFRGRICRLSLTASPQPFHVRLGSTDILVLEEIFFAGEYDCVLAAKLKDVRLIVDLGANAGFSLRLWSAVFPGATMIAVEPDPENADLCMRNSVAGGYADRVRLIQACVGAQARQTKLSRDHGAWMYAMTEGAVDEGGGTEVLTMPQILAQTNASDPIGLLKCDIEGAERELFTAPLAWISRVEYMVVELHPELHPLFELNALMQNLQDSGGKFKILYASKSGTLVLLGRGDS